jgi:hypothetical protein
MLDTSLRQHKRDPKCNHGHGVGACPTMPQIRQVLLLMLLLLPKIKEWW